MNSSKKIVNIYIVWNVKKLMWGNLISLFCVGVIAQNFSPFWTGGRPQLLIRIRL